MHNKVSQRSSAAAPQYAAVSETMAAAASDESEATDGAFQTLRSEPAPISTLTDQQTCWPCFTFFRLDFPKNGDACNMNNMRVDNLLADRVQRSGMTSYHDDRLHTNASEKPHPEGMCRDVTPVDIGRNRSEEHTSELQSQR